MTTPSELACVELDSAIGGLEYVAVTAAGTKERRSIGALACVHLRRAERLGEPGLAKRARAVAASCLSEAARCE